MTATEVAVDAGMNMVETLGEHFISITGRVVPYDEWADIGYAMERFARGAFTASLVAKPNVPLLRWHDNRSWPIGVAEAWDDRPDGLHGRFKLALTPDAQLAGAYARDDFLTGMSVGFGPTRSSWVHVASDQWDPDLGPDHMDKVTRHEARLIEVSLTPTPAYVGAMVYDVQAQAVDQRARPHLRNAQLWRRQMAGR
jgi:HK97 family phage prohead protease